MYGGKDTARVTVKTELGPVIANGPDRLTGNVSIVDDCLGRNLTGYDDHAGRQQGLTRHARHRILPQRRIQNRVRNLIRYFIGMPLGNRL